MASTFLYLKSPVRGKSVHLNSPRECPLEFTQTLSFRNYPTKLSIRIHPNISIRTREMCPPDFTQNVRKIHLFMSTRFLQPILIKYQLVVIIKMHLLRILWNYTYFFKIYFIPIAQCAALRIPRRCQWQQCQCRTESRDYIMRNMCILIKSALNVELQFSTPH